MSSMFGNQRNVLNKVSLKANTHNEVMCQSVGNNVKRLTGT